VTVTCYYGTAMAKNICAGGGDFDRVDHTDMGCGGTTDNWGTIIKDHAGNCFYRKNWKLSGVIDARQCGVVGDGIADDTTALAKCLSLADSASNPPGAPIVSTGGGQVRIDSGNIAIPSGVTLSCGGGGPLGTVPSNDYRTAQHAIWLWNDHTNSLNRFQITGANSNAASAGIDGCLILRSNGTNSMTPFDYAPNKFLPGSLRDALTEVSYFTGTAINANADSFSVRNTTILGFAQCWQSSGATRVVVDHVNCDGTAGFWVDQSGGGVLFDTPNARPFLTGIGACTNCKSYTWPGIILRQHGSAYQVLIDTTVFSSYPLEHDTVWISTPTDHVQSAAGRYDNITGVTTTTMDPDCPSSMCEYFDLPGSVFSSGTSKLSATATFDSGATALTGLNVDTSLLAVGMNVDSNSGCVPTTTIVDINSSWNTIWIAAPTSCDSGTNSSLRIWDGADTSPTHSGSLTLTATERTGDAYTITNSAGATFSNCKQQNHYVGYHVGDNSLLTRFVNCANDHDSGLQDDRLIGLLCDGQHVGEDCSDTDWVNGVLGQHVSASVVLNSDSTHALHISNSAIGPANTGRQNGRYADVEAGTLVLDNATAGVSGNLFVSNGATFRIAYIDSGNLGSGYHANDVIQGTGGTCSQEPQITIDTVNGSLVPQSWHQSLQGVCSTWPANPWATTCITVGCSGTGAEGRTDGLAGARAALSNVILPTGTLYLQRPTAPQNVAGCGNIFKSPVPFTCTPASIVPPPQGRLTLTACDTNGCYPVMRSDVTNGGFVYYVPYTGQQVPIYSNATGTFSPIDISAGGLQLNLNSTDQLANSLYDVFVHLNSGTTELCTGPAWSNTSARSSAGAITPINGIWVNVRNMTCTHATLTRQCAEFECTYLGTMYMTGAGTTSQQFGPISGTGGGAPCLCLYNAYNRVTLTSKSTDSGGSYTYATNAWRFMRNNANNRVSAVDGLGQMQISAQLTDSLTQTGRNPAIGIDFDPPSSGTPPAPTPIVQSSSPSQGSFSANGTSPPAIGLRVSQAVENATGAGTNATFGGNGYQLLSVQVDD
jgi:hypothetical protein